MCQYLNVIVGLSRPNLKLEVLISMILWGRGGGGAKLGGGVADQQCLVIIRSEQTIYDYQKTVMESIYNLMNESIISVIALSE